MGFAEMSNDELADLKYISSGENTLHVEVKGHVRNVDSSVTLLVEGGTVIFNNDGYLSSTGEIGSLLEATLGVFSTENTDGRRLEPIKVKFMSKKKAKAARKKKKKKKKRGEKKKKKKKKKK